MAAHPFTELQAGYTHDIAIMKVTRVAEVNGVAARLLKPGTINNYQKVFEVLRIPIVVQATICERENGTNFTKSPAQGDPWDKVSTHVPKGYGPYPSWFASAIASFHTIDHLDDNTYPWSLAYACWKWEAYNGFGYRSHGIRSPYLVGGTNLQQKGKYTSDGNYDPNVMDTQLGCLPIAMRMIEIMPSLSFGDAIAKITPPLIIPPTDSTPIAVGGGLTGTRWIQQSLNKVLNLEDPLIVDGSYGRQTRAIVRRFQQGAGITIDGLVGEETMKALDAALAAIGKTKPVVVASNENWWDKFKRAFFE